jgi:hypothetical protein
MIDSLKNERLEGETFEEYKERQKYMKKYVHLLKKGFLEWPSSVIELKDGEWIKRQLFGTYVKTDGDDEQIDPTEERSETLLGV